MYELHELVGQHGDEQLPISALFFVVEHGAQTQFAFETAKYRFQIGQHEVGAPQFFGIQGDLIAAQAVDAGMGNEATFGRLFRPGQCRGYCSRLVGQ